MVSKLSIVYLEKRKLKYIDTSYKKKIFFPTGAVQGKMRLYIQQEEMMFIISNIRIGTYNNKFSLRLKII